MQPRKPYHLFTHANGFENLFQSEENYRYFLSRYKDFIPAVADTMAWCLMPNHIHFLVRIKNEKEIVSLYTERYPEKVANEAFFQTLQGFKTLEEFVIRQFGHLFNSYTQAYNKMYKRRGSLFIHSFKRKEITDDQYFTKIIHYIHANPVHHGFVKEIHHWTWSSFHDCLQNNSSFTKSEEVINWFGNKEQFILFHQQPIVNRIQTEMEI